MFSNDLTHLDLFSGIGGFSLGFEAEGFRTVAFSEIDAEASLVLKHHWPGVPNLGDIRRIIALLRRCGTAETAELRRLLRGVMVVTGGVPCQPASSLGQMRGAADERWLWPEFIRLVCQVRALQPAGAPFYAVAENPPSLLTVNGGREWNGIVSALVASGFDLCWDVFPAAAVGAGHLRERVVLIAADANCQRREEPRGHFARGGTEASGSREQINQSFNGGARPAQAGIAPHADESRLEGHADLRGRVHGADWWHEAHTGIPVLADGLPARLVEAATRCTGNSIVPQVAQIIAQAIKQHEQHRTETEGD